jgi:hypothetical protein
LHGDGCLNQIVLAMQQSDRKGETAIAIAVRGLVGFGLALIGCGILLFRRWMRVPALRSAS